MTTPRALRSRALALAALLGVAAAACGHGDGPTPPPDPGPQLTIDGSYSLRTVNGSPPPVNIDPGNTCTARIVGNGALVFTEVHQVAISWEVDPGCGGTAETITQAGQYRTVNGSLVLDSSPQDTIHFVADTAVLVTHRTRPIATMIFVR